jgi:hypothetical protein
MAVGLEVEMVQLVSFHSDPVPRPAADDDDVVETEGHS